MLCIPTGGDIIDVFVKKLDKESEKFLTSTLNQPRNAPVFKLVEKSFSSKENWETDPHIAAVLNSAIFHALNLKVVRRKRQELKIICVDCCWPGLDQFRISRRAGREIISEFETSCEDGTVPYDKTSYV